MGKDKYIFHVLGGSTYNEKERPQFWHNEIPLLCDDYHRGNPPDMTQLPLHQFPLIEDFQVILEDMRDSQGQSFFGYHVHFYSPSRGYIASFPWWDNAEKDL